jgi:uncharacterized protein YidB (DUF937 family)
MSFIDDLKNKAKGESSAASSGPVAGVMHLVSSYPGGFSGLLQAFHEKGLGGVASSWVGTGANQSISAEQVQSVLGNEHIRQFAEKSGIPTEQASGKIAEYLPQVVDRLTPNGQVPAQENLIEKAKSLLKGFGGKAA